MRKKNQNKQPEGTFSTEIPIRRNNTPAPRRVRQQPPRPAPFRRRRVSSAGRGRTRWRRWASRCGWSEVSAAAARTGAAAALCCGRGDGGGGAPGPARPGSRHAAAACPEPPDGPPRFPGPRRQREPSRSSPPSAAAAHLNSCSEWSRFPSLLAVSSVAVGPTSLALLYAASRGFFLAFQFAAEFTWVPSPKAFCSCVCSAFTAVNASALLSVQSLGFSFCRGETSS